jgi:alkylation response protein AidB-like acyl-CoA dehydrogenase
LTVNFCAAWLEPTALKQEQHMHLEPDSEQLMLVQAFARFLDAESSIARVRAALPQGFDRKLWKGLGEFGALRIRMPEEANGLGLGIFDAGLLMEEAGRTLASGPLAEAIVAGRLLALLDPRDRLSLRDAVANGEQVLTLALHDVAQEPEQLVSGGAVAEAVLVRQGNKVLLLRPGRQQGAERTLASTPIARLRLDQGERRLLGEGPAAVAAYAAAVEEWKLLLALALVGLSKESIRIASVYACERQQFGRPIGSYQAVSHPLANIIVEVDAGRLMIWRVIRAIADGAPDAGEGISRVAWWACMVAERAVAQSLHTFGGYGLTLEYDIHLFNLRAKVWPLVLGDPELLLTEAARRRYQGEKATVPDAGAVPVEFALGDEAESLAAEVRAFFDRTLTPELRARTHYSFAGHIPEVHKKLADSKLLFPGWPKHMRGRGASPYAVQAALKVWRDNNYTTHAQGTVNIIGYVMERFGSEQLKQEALSRIVSGDAICSLGYSEPGSGSDVFAAKTRAVREADGWWRIDGSKMFTSGAEQADYVLLLARTDPEAPKHKGITMFIVPLKAPGVAIQAVHTFQDERTNITYYDGVRVPDSYRLGEVNGGLQIMTVALEIEQGMTFLRDHRELLHAAESFCRSNKRAGKPMIDDLLVQRRLARTAANVMACEMLHYRSIWVSAECKPNLAYGPSSKLYSSEVYRSDSCDLLNLTAPESLAFASADAAVINRCYRHSQVATVYGGTSEVQRSIVAEKQLGLPRTR